MPAPSPYEAQHLKNIAQLSGKIKELYFKQIEAIFRKATGLKLTEGQIYDLKNFPSFSKALDEAMAKMSTDMRAVIVNSVEEGWNLANVKNDSFVSSVVGDVSLPEKVYERFFDRSLPAMNEFINRKEAGLNLSDRVWSKTAQFRQEVETQLFEGITEGKAAAKMATELKANLNDPDKLFRRVRDKYGELKLSKPAKEYHPGQGRYRSSYQNALRLAGTEVNMSYRTADHERWKRINFVLGFEVKLSGNHPVPDICDEAKGKYPKEFHFRGWHPRCYSSDTEVYTDTGWKSFKDIQTGERCLSLNKETYDLEYSTVIATLKREYSGQMVRFFNRSLDLLVTPDHPLIYLGKSYQDWKERPAIEYSKSNGALYRSSKWNGCKIEYMRIGKYTWPIKLFAEFMGYYLSDGSVSFTRKSEFDIAQRNTDNWVNIRECMHVMGLPYWECEKGLGCNDVDVRNYLAQFGKSFDKFIPEEIMNSTPDVIEVFLNAFASCDGHAKRYKSFVNDRGKVFNSYGLEVVYFSSSNRMAGQLGELILKTGRRPSFYLEKAKTVRFKNGTYDCKPSWKINQCNGKTATVFNKELIDYSGFVYDVEIEKNHTLYVRRNGKCVWGSNCRCYAVPIRPDEETMGEYLDHIMDGNDPAEFNFTGQVEQVPSGFTNYLKENKQRIDGYKNKPYYLRDNKGMLKKITG